MSCSYFVLLPLLRFLIKGGLAGGAIYVVYDQGLLSGSDQGAKALRKAQEAFPPAVEEWTKYFGWQVSSKEHLVSTSLIMMIILVDGGNCIRNT